MENQERKRKGFQNVNVTHIFIFFYKELSCKQKANDYAQSSIYTPELGHINKKIYNGEKN